MLISVKLSLKDDQKIIIFIFKQQIISMELLQENKKFVKVVILCGVLLISFLIVGLFRIIIGSYLVGLILYLALIWYLLKTVGSFVMYPGSSFLTRSDIELRFSKEIGARMIVFFNAMHFLQHCVDQRKYKIHENDFDMPVHITNHIRSMTEMLGMFQETLSQRKLRILHIYRELKDLIQRKEGERLSINEITIRPRAIDKIAAQDMPIFKMRFDRITVLIKQIVSILPSFTPPIDTLKNLQFKMFEENLYQIRFGFYSWKVLFDYDVAVIKTPDGQKLQTAIIHKNINNRHFIQKQQKRNSKHRKCVLFCNPNGVFIQFFGADNEYIRNYLKLGYQIILWNYRGYGQSTGKPSIKKSQEDALTVYQYYRQKNMDIKIVHGYSIGGAAAVGLMSKLSKLSPNLQLKNIDNLIVDRSFSSIGQMSSEFGSTLHKLTKVVFFTDNIDLSKQFQQVRCRKLLIWDYSDQVIPDRASVKNRIIKRNRRSPAKSIYGCDEENEVGQLNEDISTAPDFEDVANKLAYTLKKILERRGESGSAERVIDIQKELEREASMSTSLGQSSSYVPFLMKTISLIDGGGIQLLSNPDELLKIIEKKPGYFYHICQSYVLGLVCYGSYFPLKPIIHDHQKIKQQTLLKLERNMASLQQKYEINLKQVQPMFKEIQSFDQLPKNLYYIYRRLSQLVNQCYCQEWFVRHGSLLPTNNGHNCGLTSLEISTLNNFLEHGSQEVIQMQQDHSSEAMS